MFSMFCPGIKHVKIMACASKSFTVSTPYSSAIKAQFRTRKNMSFRNTPGTPTKGMRPTKKSISCCVLSAYLPMYPPTLPNSPPRPPPGGSLSSSSSPFPYRSAWSIRYRTASSAPPCICAWARASTETGRYSTEARVTPLSARVITKFRMFSSACCSCLLDSPLIAETSCGFFAWLFRSFSFSSVRKSASPPGSSRTRVESDSRGLGSWSVPSRS
mmetsp:Transcript_27040/g.68142  ORF Transcript_27040/g.68142 Transcript_27040/m.68142 type:complete len:216 (-) Transcript_27040:9760-10407(-)